MLQYTKHFSPFSFVDNETRFTCVLGLFLCRETELKFDPTDSNDSRLPLKVVRGDVPRVQGKSKFKRSLVVLTPFLLAVLRFCQ